MAQRSETVTEVDDDLEVSHVRLASPLPAGFPDHPVGIEEIGYLRYRLAHGPEQPAAADAICVIQPGAWGGAYSLDRLARNTVRAAAAKGRTIEWWSLARRASGAWDRTGIEAAKEARNADIAFDYYYGGAEIDGRRFAGFKKDRDLRYTAELGLAQTVRDQHELLLRELPDPAVRREKVFCGGHSLGGVITGFYGAWDFDGVPGHDQYAGLIALDTLIDPEPVRIQSRPTLGPLARTLAGHAHHRMVQGLRLGIVPRTFNFLPILKPETMHVLMLSALLALYHGDEEVEHYRRLPQTHSWEIATRFYFARTWRQFLTGRPSARDFRFTGEAALGALFDDNFSPIDPLSVSMGTIDGPVAEKRFPLPPWFRRVPGLGTVLATLVDVGAIMAPTEPNHLYRWRRYDHMDDPGAPVQRNGSGEPFTSASEEVVDIQDVARQLVGGPLGFLEGYFPMRVEHDVALALAGARDNELAAIMHEAGAREGKPIAHVMAGEDTFVPALLRLIRLTPAGARFSSGYRHVDIGCGAAKQNGGRPEPVSDAVSDFVVAHSVPTLAAAS